MERLTRLVVAAIVVAVTSLGAPSALAAEFHCSDHEAGELRGNLIIPSGETCDLEDAEVFGNVVEPDGALILRDSRIRGNAQATGFDRVDFRTGSEIHGNVTLQDGRTFEADDADVFGNFEARGNTGDESRMDESRISGNLKLEKNSYRNVELGVSTVSGNLEFSENDGDYRIRDNSVGGSPQVRKNDGAGSVEDNHIGGSLQCAENDPEPDSEDNTAGEKEGQCEH